MSLFLAVTFCGILLSPLLKRELIITTLFVFQDGVSAGELKALQIVSYIGCAISIICLTITVIFFLYQRSER